MRIIYLLLMLLSLSGCASLGLSSKKECTDTIKDYNKMLRWDEFEAASLTYLESSLQDDFMQKLEELRKNRVNIADMRIKASNCINGVDNADAIVEFDYFALSDNRMKTVIDKQKWKLLRGDQLAAGQKAGWKLITPLPFFK